MPEHYTHEEHVQLHKDIIALEAELIEDRKLLAKHPGYEQLQAVQHTLRKIGVKREKLRSFMKIIQGGQHAPTLALRPGD